ERGQRWDQARRGLRDTAHRVGREHLDRGTVLLTTQTAVQVFLPQRSEILVDADAAPGRGHRSGGDRWGGQHRVDLEVVLPYLRSARHAGAGDRVADGVPGIGRDVGDIPGAPDAPVQIPQEEPVAIGGAYVAPAEIEQ